MHPEDDLDHVKKKKWVTTQNELPYNLEPAFTLEMFYFNATLARHLV
jgi:hypothetical protein